MAKAKQPVSIDGIEFDALLDQTIDYEADVPEYTTEKGFSVSDNIALKPETLSMTLYVSDTPVTWKRRFGSGNGRVDAVVKQLQNLYFAKKIVSVVTSEAVYDNMAITSISIAKSTDVGYAREIPIALKKVIVTESKTVTIPDSYGKSGTTAALAGTANTLTGTVDDTSFDTSGWGSGLSAYDTSGWGSSSSWSSGTSSGWSYSSSGSSGSNGSILYGLASQLGILG